MTTECGKNKIGTNNISVQTQSSEILSSSLRVTAICDLSGLGQRMSNSCNWITEFLSPDCCLSRIHRCAGLLHFSVRSGKPWQQPRYMG